MAFMFVKELHVFTLTAAFGGRELAAVSAIL